MSKTKAAIEMLRETDDRERDRQTWAVGVSWEYGKQYLEEVLECLGGRAMAGICRMLAEEYRHRVSGVPDLMSAAFIFVDVGLIDLELTIW